MTPLGFVGCAWASAWSGFSGCYGGTNVVGRRARPTLEAPREVPTSSLPEPRCHIEEK